MTSLHRWLAPSLAAVLGLTGCSSPNSPGYEELEPPGELVASDKERETTPNVPDEDFAALVAGNTDFGASLYREIAEPGENLFFSPFSITQAFAMVYAGARGNTETQMAQALHFTLPQERLHPAMNALDLSLQSHAGKPGEDKGTPPTFRVVNGAWGQKGLTFEPPFLDVLAQHYGSGMRVVDFSAEPDAIRDSVNDWVQRRTEGRIHELFPPDMVTRDTRLLLANALYFKGAWREPFLPDATRPAPFHLLDGSTRQVPMMSTTGSFPHMTGDGFEAVALPYVGQAFRMLVIVPGQDRFSEIESRLSASFLDSVRAGLQPSYTILRFPKFEVRQEVHLPKSMKALGMEDAFTKSANLSGMTQQEALMLTGAMHKAFVSVDEQGTEAAAATGISGGPTSAPKPTTVNRPFLFLIEDVETKSVLFLGRVVNP
ncbi:serpin family protein [Archangium violaceum]|uniref:serpin family protein n=1 Tax=Archangium violaceum TaxID=83451 RepID=UPI00193BA3A5|nr:serpin family protein [Archangium violaceum]QRK06778.1 serpin family protein [Archangium violaceum]